MSQSPTWNKTKKSNTGFWVWSFRVPSGLTDLKFGGLNNYLILFCGFLIVL